ncbi:MAG: DUF4391 domain-containing protein [Clostridia bacterium]|nr:DUF4391 domain-containing protein [Clostridia bacterium]
MIFRIIFTISLSATGTKTRSTSTKAETAEGLVARYEEVLKLNKDIDKLQKLVDSEKQPRKRFELNDELKRLRAELDKLQ